MIFFVIVIAIMFSTFGIVIKRLQTEIDEIKFSLTEIINIAYWPIFGNTDNLDSIINYSELIDNGTNSSNATISSKIAFGRFSFILLFIYMVAILVLVNLLIAIFK